MNMDRARIWLTAPLQFHPSFFMLIKLSFVAAYLTPIRHWHKFKMPKAAFNSTEEKNSTFNCLKKKKDVLYHQHLGSVFFSFLDGPWWVACYSLCVYTEKAGAHKNVVPITNSHPHTHALLTTASWCLTDAAHHFLTVDVNIPSALWKQILTWELPDPFQPK